MVGLIEQLFGGLLFAIGIGWTIVLFLHTLTVPLSEDKMRMIIREEVKKIIEETKK